MDDQDSRARVLGLGATIEGLMLFALFAGFVVFLILEPHGLARLWKIGSPGKYSNDDVTRK